MSNDGHVRLSGCTRRPDETVLVPSLITKEVIGGPEASCIVPPYLRMRLRSVRAVTRLVCDLPEDRSLKGREVVHYIRPTGSRSILTTYLGSAARCGYRLVS